MDQINDISGIILHENLCLLFVAKQVLPVWALENVLEFTRKFLQTKITSVFFTFETTWGWCICAWQGAFSAFRRCQNFPKNFLTRKLVKLLYTLAEHHTLCLTLLFITQTNNSVPAQIMTKTNYWSPKKLTGTRLYFPLCPLD